MHADNDDYDQLLMDWRADAARPFYLATAASPGDVRVRRHIKTRARTVQRLDDEVLDLTAADPSKHEGLTGESALLAALTASRTGRMRDIVETIQAEQDRIIRSGLPGVLVVQGGPGTGKTAVALHRAAYLLYTYRRQLEKRGVLVIGPNATFLRYIGQVLPSLGETSVLAGRLGKDPLGGRNLMGRADIEDLRAELRDDQEIRAAIGRLWPVLTPQQLVSDLFASRRLLAAAGRSLSGRERDLLHRPAGSAWTPADVPLLDEAAELLGEDDRAAKAEARRRREQDEAYARGVLEIIGRDDEDDPEILMGADMLDAAGLAARFDADIYLTPAERAAADRTWA